MSRVIIQPKERRKVPPPWKVAVCGGLAGLLAYVPSYPGLEADPRHMLFILVLAAGLWTSEAMPAFAVALLVIGLEILLLGHEGIVGTWPSARWHRFLEPWASPLIWLFLGGFVLSAAASKTRLDRALTQRLLHLAGPRPRRVLAALMLATFVLSSLMSNTATTAMMFVVLAPILAGLDDDPFVPGVCLGIPIAANLGGMATIIGSPPNAIAAGLLGDSEPIGFVEWIAYGLPPAAVVLVLMWMYLIRRYPAKTEQIELIQRAAPIINKATHMRRWQQRATGTVVLLTVLLWMTAGWHGIPVAVISFMPICVLTSMGVLDAEDIRRLPWEVLMLLAGGLALGVGVADTGLADWLVSALPIDTVGPILLAIALAYATLLASNFMSNTAAANVVLPIALAMGSVAPTQVVLPAALAASAAMALPISTPPNAIAFASGRIAAKAFLPVGIIIGLAMPMLIVLWVWLVGQLM